MAETIDTENLKKIFKEVGCPGIVDMVEWLKGEEAKGLVSFTLLTDPLGVAKGEFSAEAAAKLKEFTIGGKGQTPLEFFATLAEKLSEVNTPLRQKGLKYLDSVCAETVAWNKAPQRPLTPEEIAKIFDEPPSAELKKALPDFFSVVESLQ